MLLFMFFVDFSHRTTIFLIFLASHEILILLTFFHDLFIGSFLFFLFLGFHSYFIVIVTNDQFFVSPSMDVTTFHPFDTLFWYMQCSIFEFCNWHLMPVQTSIRYIQSLLLDFLRFLVAFFKEVLHKLCISARVSDHSGLTILGVPVLGSVNRLLLHASKHFVRQFNFTSVVLMDTLLLSVHISFVHFGNIFKESLEVAFFHLNFILINCTIKLNFVNLNL